MWFWAGWVAISYYSSCSGLKADVASFQSLNNLHNIG